MKTQVLIVGGYGTVGSAVSRFLAHDERILPVIAGRSAERARDFAQSLQAELRRADIADRRIDINDPGSISSALEGIGLVINCFSGPFTYAPLHLPEACASAGIHYLDVSGSFEYAERFLLLNERARQSGATLITALGANPGIPGIALVSARDDFDVLETGRGLFVLGARLDGVTPASLMELGHMFAVKPLVWQKPRWVKPSAESPSEYVGAPFNRQVYTGASLTRDLLPIPELTGLEALSFWSGSQFTGQGLVMILGLRLGLARTEGGARLLLKLLKRMGQGAAASPDALIKIVVTGKKDGVAQQRTIAVYGEENDLTALAPAIVCQQMIEGKITPCGAFVPPQVVPAADFMARLEKVAPHFSVEMV